MTTIKSGKLAALIAKLAEEKKQKEIASTTSTPSTASSTPQITASVEVTAPKTVLPTSLADKLRAIREKREKAEQTSKLTTRLTPAATAVQLETSETTSTNDQHTDKYGNTITYNAAQQRFVDIVGTGKSCVLIGAAGTGKTTSTQGGISKLVRDCVIPILNAEDHKHLVSGGPGVIIISYTRRAVNNIKRVQSEDMKNNCITSHKLIEFQPEYFEVEDLETGIVKKTMQFLPNRHSGNPLPASIHTIIVEEASMLSVDLYNQINDAVAHPVQWIFIGDINQLPPVFGPAILGYKMLELPVIELTEVYRQALESPIIRLAHRILSGKPIPASEYDSWREEGKLTLHPWKKKLREDKAALTLAAFFKQAIDTGVYNVDEDMILIPYNQACGTIELNKHIANHLARKENKTTYEILAGFNKHYLSVGDKILVDKEDAEVIEIKRNPAYTGARVQPESKFLDYWGHNPNIRNEKSSYEYGIDDVDLMLAAVQSDSEDRVTQASHTVVVRLLDSGSSLSLGKAAEINTILHSYALTVHKAQGSEWRKVFLCLHQSHAKMLQRELLYTAVTRAREELYCICEPESFTKGILSQKIKGNTLAEKAEFFKGKLEKAA